MFKNTIFKFPYYKNHLQEVCSNGTYVLNEECIKCQDAFKDNAPCNKSTGKFDNERSYHWNGKDFKGTFIVYCRFGKKIFAKII